MLPLPFNADLNRKPLLIYKQRLCLRGSCSVVSLKGTGQLFLRKISKTPDWQKELQHQ